MAKGTVKWFNTEKGYGFIQPADGGKDIFVHITAVQAAGLQSLKDNQPIEYELIDGRDGRKSAGAAQGLRRLRLPAGTVGPTAQPSLADLSVDKSARAACPGRRDPRRQAGARGFQPTVRGTPSASALARSADDRGEAVPRLSGSGKALPEHSLSADHCSRGSLTGVNPRPAHAHVHVPCMRCASCVHRGIAVNP